MTAPNKKQASKIQKQKAALRASLWPGLDEDRLWLYKATGGWLNIPRAMPLLLRIMDNMSKGKPVSATYFDLWCRTFNDSFVIGNKPREMAFYAGFNGERAERTWADRMAILTKLGFIDIRDGSHGPTSYILILNPFHVLKEHHAKGNIDAKSYNALLERLIETGTDELAEPAEDVLEGTSASDGDDELDEKPAASPQPVSPISRWRRPGTSKLPVAPSSFASDADRQTAAIELPVPSPSSD